MTQGQGGGGDDFASVVSHELRSALLPISLFVEAMLIEVRDEGRVPSRDELVERLESFKRQLTRANRDVTRLLDFSRIRQGQLELELEAVDWAATVADVVAAHRDELARAGCSVRVDAPRAIVGRWDRLRLQQLVATLLSNAIKYGAGGAIDIALWANDERAQLVVRDHGPGIAADERDSLFARFERLQPSQRQSGYGVGLWVAARVVEALGGAIDVDSAPGEGATFTVTLPRRGDADHSRRR